MASIWSRTTLAASARSDTTQPLPGGDTMRLKWDRFVWWAASQVLRLASRRYQEQLHVVHVLGRREIERRLKNEGNQGARSEVQPDS